MQLGASRVFMFDYTAYLDALIAVARTVEIDHHIGVHLWVGIDDLGAIISRERRVQQGNLFNLHAPTILLTISGMSSSAAPGHVLAVHDASVVPHQDGI